jgi:hypothetical protein
MDRYYNNNVSTKRTARNQSLYKNIYEDSEYSNIEGIATMDDNNEVDIVKIKNMLKNYNENNNRELKKVVPKEFPKYETFEEDDNRVYDIRDILNKAKSTKETETYHNLDQENIDLLRNPENYKKMEKPANDLEGMIDTITNTSKLNKLSDNELGLDLFSDLQSKENTIIESKDSIRSILEEAKKKEIQEKEDNTTSNKLDQSFFTSSLSFKDEDFEGIAELKNSVNKNNKLIRILLVVVSIAITVAIIILLFNVLK